MKDAIITINNFYESEDYLMGLQYIREDVSDMLEANTPGTEKEIEFLTLLVKLCEEEDWNAAFELLDGQLSTFDYIN